MSNNPDALTPRQQQVQERIRQVEQEILLRSWTKALDEKLEPIMQRLSEVEQTQGPLAVAPVDLPELPDMEELAEAVFERIWGALKTPLTETFGEVKKLQQQVSEVETHNTQLQGENAQLKQENQTLQGQVKKLTTRCQELETYQKQTLQPHLTTTNLRLESLEAFEEEARNRIPWLSKKNKS